ncbi:DUF3021 domain-containing protein [Caryophanon tenue]|nr:DUF3021 domain-containing protein [Caryophanon tenue]
MMQVLRVTVMSMLISLSCSYIIVTSILLRDNTLTMNGTQLVEQVVLSALLGIGIGVLSLLFQLERIPFIVQFILHACGVVALVFTAGAFGNWYDVYDMFTVVVVLLITVIIYSVTWAMLRITTKKDVDTMNATLQKRRGDM